MLIDRLEQNRILVTLCGKDMDDFSLDFNTLGFDDAHSRRILMRILQLACFKSGIEVTGKNILVEALPVDGGCYILLTVIEKYRHRTYKIKTSSGSLCYFLGGSGNFLDTVEKLYKQNVCCNKNSAYLYDNKYYLIFDYPSIPYKLRRILLEYAVKCGGKVTAARIRENGKSLCKVNAIAQIGQYL